jgi:hypothetical protein
LSTVPDKRQTSKQRRAARNRASRDALAARRENAVLDPSPAPRSARSTGSAKGRAGATTTAATAAGPAVAADAPPKGALGMLRSKRPGDKAVFIAFVFSVCAGIFLFFYRVPVDDRGEPLPFEFRGLTLAAREAATGAPVEDATTSMLDANGPVVLLLVGLPIFVSAFAMWGNRRPDRSRMLTYAMLGMAVAVIVVGQITGVGVLFFPALIAMAVGGFQVRKADLPARTAARGGAAAGAARGQRGRGGVVEADSRDVTDDDVSDDEVGDDVAPRNGSGTAVDDRSLRSLWARRRPAPAPDDGVVDEHDVHDGGDDDADAPGEAPEDEVEYDPLAELEAEIQAEHAERAADGDDEPGDQGGSGTSR